MIDLGTALLMLAVTFTVGHAISDVVIAAKHMIHPRDMLLTYVSLAFLMGHVIFTGELRDWFGWIG